MKNFSKSMEQIAYKHTINNVFDDFLTIAICSLTFGKMEQEYLNVIKKYDKKEIILFSEAFANLILDYEEISKDGDWGDVLGEYYMSINSQSNASNRGQFFTPVSICKMMAEMVEEKKIIVGISVNDCSCGSSRNLIAHSRLNPENRLNTFYVGQDLDLRCVKMSVLNFFFYGIKN
jgi:type I restriction enzyme M protein